MFIREGITFDYNQNTHVTSRYNRQYGGKEVNHGGEALVNNNTTILKSCEDYRCRSGSSRGAVTSDLRVKSIWKERKYCRDSSRVENSVILRTTPG